MNENTVWEKSIETLFNQELENVILLKLAKLISRLDHRLKYILFTSMGWNFGFQNSRFRRINRIKTNYINLKRWSGPFLKDPNK